MSDYLAKQMLGPEAEYGMARVVWGKQETINGVIRFGFAGLFLAKTQIEIVADKKTWNLMDAHVYIKPMRKETFRGQRGLRLDQAMHDFHFQNAFGECVTEEDPFCDSCKSRGYKVKK